MRKGELLRIAHDVADCIVNNGDDVTIESVADYVEENFFTFSKDEKIQILNTTIDEYFALPFC